MNQVHDDIITESFDFQMTVDFWQSKFLNLPTSFQVFYL